MLYRDPISQLPDVPAPTVFAPVALFPSYTRAVVFFSYIRHGVYHLGRIFGWCAMVASMTLQQLVIEGENFQLLAELPGIGRDGVTGRQFFYISVGFILFFNGLMLLEMGRRIEVAQGSQRLLFW